MPHPQVMYHGQTEHLSISLTERQGDFAAVVHIATRGKSNDEPVWKRSGKTEFNKLLSRLQGEFGKQNVSLPETDDGSRTIVITTSPAMAEAHAPMVAMVLEDFAEEHETRHEREVRQRAEQMQAGSGIAAILQAGMDDRHTVHALKKFLHAPQQQRTRR